MHITSRCIGASLVLAGVLGCMVRQSVAGPDLAAFPTPAWQPEGELLLRTDGAKLLLKQSTGLAAYLYDPETASLVEVAETVWLQAEGPVVECDAQIPPRPSVLKLDPTSGNLVTPDRVVSTVGAIPLSLRESPSGTQVAVLSAHGHRRGSILPFLGEGGVAGLHYHQVLSLPDAMPVGDARLLPLESVEVGIRACWSGDENYVVYGDILCSRIVVVELNRMEGQTNVER